MGFFNRYLCCLGIKNSNGNVFLSSYIRRILDTNSDIIFAIPDINVIGLKPNPEIFSPFKQILLSFQLKTMTFKCSKHLRNMDFNM